MATTFSPMNTNLPIRSGIYLCFASVLERFEKGRGKLFSTGKHSTGKLSHLLISWGLYLKMTVENCEVRNKRKKRKSIAFSVRDSTIQCHCYFESAIGQAALVNRFSVTRVWVRRIMLL